MNMRNRFGFNVTCFIVLLCIVLGHDVSAAQTPNMGSQGITVHNNDHLQQGDNLFDVPFAQNNLNNNALVERGGMQEGNDLLSPLIPTTSFFPNELTSISPLPSNGLNNNDPFNDQDSMAWDQSSIRNLSPCFTQLTTAPLYPSLGQSYNNPLNQQSNLNYGQQVNRELFNDGSSIGWNNNAPTEFNASPRFTPSTTTPFDALGSNYNNLNHGQETNNGFHSEQPHRIAWDNESTGFNLNPASCFTQPMTAPRYASLVNNCNESPIQNNLNHVQQPNRELFNDGSSIGWNNNAPTEFNASPRFTPSTTTPFDALGSNYNNLNHGQETNNGFHSEQPHRIAWDNESTGFNLNPASCFTQPMTAPRYASLVNNCNESPIQNNLNHVQQPNRELFNDGSSIGWNNNALTEFNASPRFTPSTTILFDTSASRHNNPLFQNNNLNHGQETNDGFHSEQPHRIAWDNESIGFNFNPSSCLTQQPTTAPHYASLANNCNEPPIQNNLNSYQDLNIQLPTFHLEEQQRIGLQEKSILTNPYSSTPADLTNTFDNQATREVDVNAMLPMIDASAQGKKRKVPLARLDKCESVPPTPKNNIALPQRTQSVRPQAVHNKKRKKLTCYLCNKSFSRKEHLTRHLKSVHFKEKPYQCPHCEKRFAEKSNLKRHVRTHTGEKSHPCFLCKKSFTRNDSLKKHVQEVHTKSKSFVCVICEKSYTQKNNLFRHMRTTHFKEKYDCPKCNKSLQGVMV